MSLENLSKTLRAKDDLTSWVMQKVEEWGHYRDVEHGQRWDEYYRLWRGIWSPEDQQRLKQRSRVIMPALQQAVESAVAELEEAVFGREKWFDLSDDVLDEEAVDMMLQTKLLAEDFDQNDVPRGIRQCFLLAALYGTGIGKLSVSKQKKKRGRVKIELLPMDPREFVIDPSATTIDEALGVAHTTFVPRHIIIDKQQKGIYAPIDAGSFDDTTDGNPNPDLHGKGWTDSEKVWVVEWHGKVPARFLQGVDPLEDTLDFMDEEENYVEAIVTIGNKDTLLRATVNPLNDRGVIAFPYDDVPNSFYGRGIMERGYWPQKVLDTEVRSRIISLGFSTLPMMAINNTVVPRGQTWEARAGKNLFLNGEVNGNIQPIQFPSPDPQTYRQTAEMERMVESATGQMQASSPMDINARNSTASGMSMMMSSSIKRSKRTLLNIERMFLAPLIRKSLLRYKEFDNRYEGKVDLKFRVIGTTGMIAKELEINQMIQILQTMPPQSVEYYFMMKMIVGLMGISQRENVSQVLDRLMQQAAEPPPEPQPDFGDQARLMGAQTRQQQLEMDTQFRQISLQIEASRAQTERERVEVERQRNVANAVVAEAQAAADQIKKEAEAIKAVAQAEAAEVGSQLDQYKAVVESLGQQVSIDEEGNPMPQMPGGVNEDQIRALIQQAMSEQQSGDTGLFEVERDPVTRLVMSVNGRPVQRDEQNLIVGIG